MIKNALDCEVATLVSGVSVAEWTCTIKAAKGQARLEWLLISMAQRSLKPGLGKSMKKEKQ